MVPTPSPSREALSPDEALPPVQPPTAGFVIQLFVIPAVIVGLIIVVWLTFNWLAQMGNDPQSYVQALMRRNSGAWHAAMNLSAALQADKDAVIKNDTVVASELAAVLDAEIESESAIDPQSDGDEQSIRLRIFVCKALGEFHVEQAMPALLRAAGLERGPGDVPVRIAAMQGLAVLVDNLREHQPSWQPPENLTPTLLDASRAEDRETRHVAAFALGIIGDEASLRRLHQLLSDEDPDTRYNAATGLARHGDPASVPVLVEMLSPDQSRAVLSEREGNRKSGESYRGSKTELIHINALRAVQLLAAENSSADLRPLALAVDQLLAADLPDEVRAGAKLIAEQLRSHQAAVR